MSDTLQEQHPMADAVEHAIAPDMAAPLTHSLPALVGEAKQGFMPVPMDDIDAVAARLGKAALTARPAFADNPEACWLVAYQAARWGSDPVFLLQKAFIVSDKSKGTGGVAYEAQVLMMLVNRFAPIKAGGINYRYGYGGDGSKTVMNRFCEAWAFDARSGERKSVITPTVAQIKVKNSPLWFSDADQQLAYYAGRAFARRHYPEVLGGVHAVEEYVQVTDLSPRTAQIFEEEEPQDADFSDQPQPTAADAKAYEAWERKASGEGDSRDPRDAPANKPPPPPTGSAAPDDMPELRTWAAGEQVRIMALTDPAKIGTEWQLLIADKRWTRFRTYDPEAAKKIKDAVAGHIQRQKDAKAASANPATGEV